MASLILPVIPAGGQAHALEIFGVKLFKSRADKDRESVVTEPQDYDVTVDVDPATREMESVIKAASSLWRKRDEPAAGAAGLIVLARGDYRSILGALYREGHYGGVISITIDGQEASAMRPDSTVTPEARVVVSVKPGPPFTFGRTAIINQAPTAEDGDDVVDVPSSKGFAPGLPARSAAVRDAAALAVEVWRQQGHAKARIADKDITADHATNILDAEMTVEPGRLAQYGTLAVEGTARMDPEFVAWMAGLEPGQEYDPDDIERASKRLARLDVFQSQRFVEAESIGDDGILPMSLVVQERKLRRIGLGATWSSTDGAGVEGYWIHRNLFGRAERLRLEGKVAGLGRSSDPRDFDYLLGATFTKPGVFTRDTNLEVAVKGERETLPAYVRTAVLARTGFTHLFSEQLSARAFATFERSRIEDSFGRRDFMMAGLDTALTWDSRDNAADATRGFYLQATAFPFHEFQYANTAVRATGEARAYQKIDAEGRAVLAGRVMVGMLAGVPIAQAPPDKLFFAGGGGSVRGYSYKSIGLGQRRNLKGGLSVFEASVEARVKVTDTIGLVAFADAGTVGPDIVPDFKRMLYGAGLGLRYYTGLGPIRLDVAMPLNRRRGDSSFAFYAGIGQAF